MSKIALWIGVVMMLVAIVDSHSGQNYAILFPIGATIMFVSLVLIERHSVK